MKRIHSLVLALSLLLSSSIGQQEFALPGDSSIALENGNDNDGNKSVQDIVVENGWAYQEFTVTTSDGYILTIYRIPGKLTDTVPYSKKPAVLLQHGLESDASQWVINSPELASAFNLATAGYDVWMGNNRGCAYSLGHVSLDPFDKHDKPLYWDFSFEEMGLYDLPATIDFILEQTGQEQLSYVGHSEGTTQMFIGLSMNNSYFKEKVNVFIALAPVARLDHTMSTLLKLVASQIDFVEYVVVDVLGYYDMFPPNFLDNELTALFCDLLEPICDAMLELFADLDTEVDNMDRINTYMTHVPAGACYMDFTHYGQILNAKKFQRYDWGMDINKALYHQTTPPEYNLKNIDMPIALFAGSLDELADPTDVEWLNEQLGSNVIFYHTYRLGHMSFAIAKDMSWFQVDAMAIIAKYATNTI